ncbi:hypothetical protein FKQ62_08135 [Vibrio sp. B1-2]|nr:hypothetical protein [Vibrio sp. B1-2]
MNRLKSQKFCREKLKLSVISSKLILYNKRLKRDCQRVAALVQNLSSVFTVCFLSSAVRCQPLSRALCNSGKFRDSIFWDFSDHSFCVVGK